MRVRVAALGDIHGNLPAFERVLAAIGALGVDQVWCHGDVCYGGPWQLQCAELLREAAAVVTRGNTDDWVCAEPGEVTAQNEGGRQILEIAGRDGQVIGSELRAWLRSLPTEHDAGGSLVLTHATRRSHWALIPELEASDEAWLAAYGPAPGVVVCGHNHMAFLKRVGAELTVVNTGSVGAPADGDWRASFVVLEQARDGWSFEHVRVEYDRAAAEQAFASLGHVEGDRFAHVLRTATWPGRSQ